jgi:hypothetical protein
VAFLNQDRSSKKSEGKSAYEDLFGRPRTVTFSGIPRPRSHALSSCMPPRACVWCVVHTVCRSLSFCDPGLLNAIDGIASQEGRLFVMTTNHMEHLDPGMASSDFPAEWPSTTHATHTTHDTHATRAHSADTTWTRGQGGPLRAGFHAASRAHVPAVRASCAPSPQSSVGDGPVRAV